MNDSEEVVKAPEYELNLDEIQPQKHNFVQRGIVISCEGAGHANHRHFLSSIPKPKE